MFILRNHIKTKKENPNHVLSSLFLYSDIIEIFILSCPPVIVLRLLTLAPTNITTLSLNINALYSTRWLNMVLISSLSRSQYVSLFVVNLCYADEDGKIEKRRKKWKKYVASRILVYSAMCIYHYNLYMNISFHHIWIQFYQLTLN